MLVFAAWNIMAVRYTRSVWVVASEIHIDNSQDDLIDKSPLP